MAQFNFTVRATDSEGSFADRQFSINVRNTKVDRYMALTATDAYTSVDGNTWTLRPGAGGNVVQFNNLMWLIMTTAGVKISNDGINFNTVAYSDDRMTFKDMITGEVAPSFGIKSAAPIILSNLIRYGTYFGLLVRISGTTNYFMRSQDGLNWEFQQVSLPGLNTARNSMITYDSGSLFIGNTATGTIALMGWRSDDNGKTWNTVTRAALSFPCYWLGRINGLYLAFSHSSTGSITFVMTSNDGINWTQNSYTAVPTYNSQYFRVCNVVYLNGRLVALVEKPSTTSTANTFIYMTSMDGITWTQTQDTSLVSGSVSHPINSVYRNGKILLAVGTANNLGTKTTTDGLTWTTTANATTGLPTAAITDLASM